MPTLSTRNPPRTLIVGWRSVDWPIVHPLLDAGHLPHLRALVERGISAPLASPRPLAREALWATLATGHLADRHGLLGPAEIRPDRGGVQPTGRRSWRVPAFWEVLEPESIRTACINWPATAPAADWPGLHIDERFAPATGDSFEAWTLPSGSVSPDRLSDPLLDLRIHPADPIQAEIAALVPRWKELAERKDARLARLASMLAATITAHAAATHVAERELWDVLCVVYDLAYAAAVAFGPADAEHFGDVPTQALLFQDMMLGRLIELAGPDTTVVVASPNGISRGPDGALRGHPRGLLVAAGPGIAADAMLPGVAAADLAPTILARYGLSLPTDGRLIEALAPHAATRAVTIDAPQATDIPPDPAEALLAEGYTDPVTPEQASAMAQAAATRLLHWAAARVERGHYAEAATALETALRLRPAMPEALRALARCRALLGDYAGCRPLGEQLLAADPESPWGHLMVGTAYALDGSNAAMAEPYLASARELGAEDPAVLSRLGGLAMLRQRPADAELLFRQALAIDPGRADALFGLGLAREAEGDAAGAEQAIRRAVQAQYHLPLAHQRLGVLLMAQGRWREAAQELRTAHGQHPSLPEIDAQLQRAQGHAAAELLRHATLGRPHQPPRQ